ncbi:MAG TPA: mannose-6-phosphate isomerase, class I [Parafilimonas sp.]|nr:mannose-6-phosphate isomerase, class I [Parafilimonas sp.]
MLQDKIFKLKGKVQPYAWGGKEFIPAWLGVENRDEKPFAEYWMGAHPSASSTVIIDNAEQSLYDLIKKRPVEFLNEQVAAEFGELPYLLKILDVKDMLSIQVHPSKEAAKIGFDEEEEKGVPINASNRNYKDKNHKPEVMVALSEFWLLHGFLPETKLLHVLRRVPEFNGFEKFVKSTGYKGLYEHVMTMPQKEVNKLLRPVVEKAIAFRKENKITKHQPGWWAAKLYEHVEPTDIDRGLFSIYFFNIVRLRPGEAIFQGAGVPHAYLEGQNVELMANSDNVLRGGLTPKHVDVPELMKQVVFESIEPKILNGVPLKNGEINYPCPVRDFGISKIELQPSDNYQAASRSFEILVAIKGSFTIKNGKSLQVKKGEAVAILPNEAYEISTNDHLLAYKAFVP